MAGEEEDGSLSLASMIDESQDALAVSHAIIEWNVTRVDDTDEAGLPWYRLSSHRSCLPSSACSFLPAPSLRV
jgi:hypothetical protein